MTMERNQDNGWSERLAIINMQIKSLQDAVTSLEEKQVSQFLSRQQLAEELRCSSRFLRDNHEFRSIEHKLGGRIFYIRDEVDMIIRQSPSKLGE